jgi:hypothetical protein
MRAYLSAVDADEWKAVSRVARESDHEEITRRAGTRAVTLDDKESGNGDVTMRNPAEQSGSEIRRGCGDQSRVETDSLLNYPELYP